MVISPQVLHGILRSAKLQWAQLRTHWTEQTGMLNLSETSTMKCSLLWILWLLWKSGLELISRFKSITGVAGNFCIQLQEEHRKKINPSIWNYDNFSDPCFFFFYISLKAQGEQNNSCASSNMSSCTFGPLGKSFFILWKWKYVNENEKKCKGSVTLCGDHVLHFKSFEWGLSLQAHKRKHFPSDGFGVCFQEEEKIRILMVPVPCKGI